MAELRKLEYFLLRYVPDVVKGEFINFGLVMFEQGTNGSGFADVRFTHDWSALECIDPQVDITLLQGLEQEIRQELVATKDMQAFVRKLEDSFSSVVQLSSHSGVLTANPDAELKTLATHYFKRIHSPRNPLPVGRRTILRGMEEAFMTANVIGLMGRDFDVSALTKPGDPLLLDFYYPTGNNLKFLQAVSLHTSVDQAVILASRFPILAGSLKEKKDTPASLTAVIDNELDPTRPEVGFALGMMRDNDIAVRPIAEIASLAESIRLELRA